MIKVIIYVLIAVMLGLSKIVLPTPWVLITAPIWSPLFVALIDKTVKKIKLKKKDERSIYKG